MFLISVKGYLHLYSPVKLQLCLYYTYATFKKVTKYPQVSGLGKPNETLEQEAIPSTPPTPLWSCGRQLTRLTSRLQRRVQTRVTSAEARQSPEGASYHNGQTSTHRTAIHQTHLAYRTYYSSEECWSFPDIQDVCENWQRGCVSVTQTRPKADWKSTKVNQVGLLTQ